MEQGAHTSKGGARNAEAAARMGGQHGIHTAHRTRVSGHTGLRRKPHMRRQEMNACHGQNGHRHCGPRGAGTTRNLVA